MYQNYYNTNIPKTKKEASLFLKSRLIFRLITIHRYFHHIYVTLTKKANHPKVFCVGMQRTGTTSLNKAFKILGYRSVHLLTTFKEPKIGWIEHIKKLNYDAYSDAPMNWIGFYKKLDEAFPDAKFILTLRDTDSNLRSWENFFNGHPWGIYNEQDREELRKRIETHNMDVIRHFKDRPGKLLVMDITKGDGWEKLCKFLDKPIPDLPFPRIKKPRI